MTAEPATSPGSSGLHDADETGVHQASKQASKQASTHRLTHPLNHSLMQGGKRQAGRQAGREADPESRSERTVAGWLGPRRRVEASCTQSQFTRSHTSIQHRDARPDTRHPTRPDPTRRASFLIQRRPTFVRCWFVRSVTHALITVRPAKSATFRGRRFVRACSVCLFACLVGVECGRNTVVEGRQVEGMTKRNSGRHGSAEHLSDQLSIHNCRGSRGSRGHCGRKNEQLESQKA